MVRDHRRVQLHQSQRDEAPLVLGRYRLSSGPGPALGKGRWCVVRRAEDTLTGQSVAVKTYNAQAARDLGDERLAEHWAREVQVFEHLGVGPASAAASGRPDPRRLRSANPRQWLVNLLDFSRESQTGRPGKAADGHYYTILEMADCTLTAWIQKRDKAAQFVNLAEVREIVSAVARGLLWLHSKGYCHLDVKPDNIMRFGSSWKLIDLAGCVPSGGDVPISSDQFTPLYASPELARCALGHSSLMPSSAMDMWATGVVLLDLMHSTAFEDTQAGFNQAWILGKQDVEPNVEWYKWLVESPLDLKKFISEPTSSVQMFADSAELRDLLAGLLERDPARRLSAVHLQNHPFLVAGIGGRATVEAAFHKIRHRIGRQSLTHSEVSALFTHLGMRSFDSEALLQACGSLQKGHASFEELTFEELMDFVYG